MYIKMQKAELCFYQSSHQSSYYQEEITINILISVYLQIYMSSVFTMIVLYTLHNSIHTTLYCLCFNFNVLLQLFFHITKIIFSFCLSLYHCVCVCMLICFSCVRLFVILWTVAHQAPLSMGFSRQEYWSGLPLPPPGDLPDSVIEQISPVSPALAGRFFTTALPGKPFCTVELK